MRELDNPAWHALSGEQRAFGLVGERAARYRPDVSPIAAVADQSTDALVELAGFVEPGQFVAVFGPGELPDALWRLAGMAPLSQWVCADSPIGNAQTDWVELGDEHAPDMLRLARETDPGPFESATHLLGDYVGVLRDGKLVAMAGERICMRGYREVSAVCTEAAHTGRGYAQALVLEIVRRQRRLGCVPFLHVRTGSPAESQAIHVYEKLGFRKRGDYAMSILVRK